jgi:uracil-DNA glycosylase family 4
LKHDRQPRILRPWKRNRATLEEVHQVASTAGRRLHKRPNNYEVERCKIWLEYERRLVKPSMIVALGVTAARSLTGRTVTIGKVRGKPIDVADGTQLIITVHPSALLRIEDEGERHAAYRNFVADLQTAAAADSRVAKHDNSR